MSSIEWQEQYKDLWYAEVPGARLYYGYSTQSFDPIIDRTKCWWEVVPHGAMLRSKWGYADTLEEAAAMALAIYVLEGV
jgi:hypothetical protein